MARSKVSADTGKLFALKPPTLLVELTRNLAGGALEDIVRGAISGALARALGGALAYPAQLAAGENEEVELTPEEQEAVERAMGSA